MVPRPGGWSQGLGGCPKGTWCSADEALKSERLLPDMGILSGRLLSTQAAQVIGLAKLLRASSLSAVQCSAVQCSAVQCSPVECSAVQRSAV